MDVTKFMQAKEFDFTKHEEVRKEFRWGSFGKNQDEALKVRYLVDLSTNHIFNILRTQCLEEDMFGIFILELCYRAESKEG